ncbi:MAG: PP2C family protein-serine/threonine phosphatase, partial [Verrucomicrobia bacterium]|nr:PP2C family protein-serine/threonine phosphatase [Verrucomicrobiota bacterium]
QKEQEFARQIQQSFLPREMPDIPRVTIKGCNQPARHVSGDFYDVIQLSPTKIALIVGDVTGKGVASSLYMVRCLFDTRRSAYTAGGDFSPAGILAAKNETLSREAAERLAEEMSTRLEPHPPIFLAMLCVTFDAATGELRYANAGLPDPILHSAAGAATLPTAGGPALGMLPGMEFAESTRTLTGGETLVLFTDGLSEARNLGQVEFGNERICESLAHAHNDAAGAALRIAEDVLHFVGSAERHDDLTFLVLHYAKG